MSEIEIKKVLLANPFFKGIDEEVIKSLAGHSRIRCIKEGEPLTEVGKKAGEFYVVLKGSFHVITDKLESLDFEKAAPVPIQTLGAHEVVGWSWFFPPYQWRFRVKAAEDSEVIAIDGEYVRAQCDKNPKLGYEVAKRLMKCMTDRLYATRMQLAMHSGKPFMSVEGG